MTLPSAPNLTQGLGLMGICWDKGLGFRYQVQRFGGFPKRGVPPGGLMNKDYSILGGLYGGPPCAWKRPVRAYELQRGFL